MENHRVFFFFDRKRENHRVFKVKSRLQVTSPLKLFVLLPIFHFSTMFKLKSWLQVDSPLKPSILLPIFHISTMFDTRFYSNQFRITSESSSIQVYPPKASYKFFFTSRDPQNLQIRETQQYPPSNETKGLNKHNLGI